MRLENDFKCKYGHVNCICILRSFAFYSRFVPRSQQSDYISIIKDEGCYSSSIGKRPWGGEQTVSIGDGCQYKGTVLHEFMHAIGKSMTWA